MRKLAVLLTLAGGFASIATAGGLSKPYKNWDRTPEAYFLTNAERAEWKKVKTDAEAQNFILDYKAKRGPEWEKTLAERVAAADKYFSAGETKGSMTLRGKVIILFGPPSAIESGKGKIGAESNANSSITSHGGRDDGVALGSGGAGPLNYAAPHAQSPTFTFKYDESAAPKAIGKPFKVELKMISNADQESWDPKDLDAKFEAVAQASIQAGDAEKKPAETSTPH